MYSENSKATMKLVLFTTLLCLVFQLKGQDIGYHLNISSGFGQVNLKNVWHTNIMGPNGQPITKFVSTGTGTNYSVAFSPQISIKKIRVGPVLGFRAMNISLDNDMPTQFKNFIQYGLSFEYRALGKNISLGPLIQVGFFDPASEEARDEWEKGKIYLTAGLNFSKEITRWRLSLRPNISYCSMHYTADENTLYDNKVLLFNLDLGIDLKLK